MILFSEALSLAEVNKEKQNKPCCVFLGRMQPPTLNHIKVVKDAYSKYHEKVFIGVVSSSNKNSPFTYDLIENILEDNLNSNFNIFKLNSGFLGDWLTYCRDEGYEPEILICGDDRASDYQEQIDRYKDMFNLNIKIDTSLPRSINISGTMAREYIKDNDKESFRKIVTPQTFKYYDDLRKYI